MRIPVDPIDIQNNKDMAAISYVWILSIAVWFARKDSPFARYHARQGIALFLLSLVAGMLPIIGPILLLLIFAGMIYGFVQAGKGEVKEVPIIGELVGGRLSMGTVKHYWSELLLLLKKIIR